MKIHFGDKDAEECPGTAECTARIDDGTAWRLCSGCYDWVVDHSISGIDRYLDEQDDEPTRGGETSG